MANNDFGPTKAINNKARRKEDGVDLVSSPDMWTDEEIDEMVDEAMQILEDMGELDDDDDDEGGGNG